MKHRTVSEPYMSQQSIYDWAKESQERSIARRKPQTQRQFLSMMFLAGVFIILVTAAALVIVVWLG